MDKKETFAMPTSIIEKIDKASVIAVLVIDELKHALPVANALLEGGVEVIELTLRTPIALEVAALIKKKYPEITLGFGTVLTKSQVRSVIDVGADFAVSPGCNPKIIREAARYGLPFAPGIMSPTDLEIAVQEGCRVLKFFPAETSGGLKHLESISAPYNHLGVKFIPLGGCSINNARTYLESKLITAIGGTWIAKQELIRSEQWSTISENALEIRRVIEDISYSDLT